MWQARLQHGEGHAIGPIARIAGATTQLGGTWNEPMAFERQRGGKLPLDGQENTLWHQILREDFHRMEWRTDALPVAAAAHLRVVEVTHDSVKALLVDVEAAVTAVAKDNRLSRIWAWDRKVQWELRQKQVKACSKWLKPGCSPPAIAFRRQIAYTTTAMFAEVWKVWEPIFNERTEVNWQAWRCCGRKSSSKYLERVFREPCRGGLEAVETEARSASTATTRMADPMQKRLWQIQRGAAFYYTRCVGMTDDA